MSAKIIEDPPKSLRYHGYDETRKRVVTPYKGRNKPESQTDANRANARLRGPDERANAQLK